MAVSHISFYISDACNKVRLINQDGNADGSAISTEAGFPGGYFEFTIEIPGNYTLEIDDVAQDGCTNMFLDCQIATPTAGGVVILDSDGNPADSGKVISTDGTLADNSDNKISTQKAVKTYTAPHLAHITSDGSDHTALWSAVALNTAKLTYPAEDAAKLALLTVTAATNLDTIRTTMATDAGIVNLLAAGGTNATRVIRAIAALISDDTAVGRMLAANKQDYITGAGTPDATGTVPDYIGQLYFDTTAALQWWRATGTASDQDWGAVTTSKA